MTHAWHVAWGLWFFRLLWLEGAVGALFMDIYMFSGAARLLAALALSGLFVLLLAIFDVKEENAE